MTTGDHGKACYCCGSVTQGLILVRRSHFRCRLSYPHWLDIPVFQAERYGDHIAFMKTFETCGALIRMFCKQLDKQYYQQQPAFLIRKLQQTGSMKIHLAFECHLSIPPISHTGSEKYASSCHPICLPFLLWDQNSLLLVSLPLPLMLHPPLGCALPKLTPWPQWIPPDQQVYIGFPCIHNSS